MERLAVEPLTEVQTGGDHIRKIFCFFCFKSLVQLQPDTLDPVHQGFSSTAYRHPTLLPLPYWPP